VRLRSSITWGAMLVLPLLLCGAVGAQESTDAARCLSGLGGNSDQVIQNCTVAILSGQLTDAGLAAAYESRGSAYSDKNDFDHAIEDFTQAITLAPNDPRAFGDRGFAYNRKRQYDLAIADLSRAIEIDPQAAEAWGARAIAYSYKKDFDHALPDYDEAIRLMPDYANAYYNRGTAHYFHKDFDQAIADYTNAIEMNPDYAQAYYNRGNAYADEKQYAKAIDDYTQSLRIRPDDAETLGARGILRMCLGDFKMALADEVRSYQLDPTDEYAAIWLYVVQRRNHLSGRAELAKNSAGFDQRDWPWPVVQLDLGKLPPAAVMAAAGQGKADDLPGQQCEADFFVGEYELLAGNRAAARMHFQAAIDSGLTNYYEYISAQTELAALSSAK
jgi:lipoprotein NlpI